MFTKLSITYAGDYDQQTLEFGIRQTPPAQSWAEKVQLAKKLNYPIDDPERFYGFGSLVDQQHHAIDLINNCIDTINKYKPIIHRHLTSVDDQDYLNFLHHIFETYHGLLDQQDHEFWLQAPLPVRQALADLNIQVHRCETVSRGANPRHVVTFFGLPKIEVLDDVDYDFFTDSIEFGTVYLNYCEIGKTLENLTEDDDRYISDQAFQPFRHISADFNVQYWTSDHRQLYDKHVKIKKYYEQHVEFFEKQELYWGHPYLRSGSLPVADLETKCPNVIRMISNRQRVSKVEIS